MISLSQKQSSIPYQTKSFYKKLKKKYSETLTGISRPFPGVLNFFVRAPKLFPRSLDTFSRCFEAFYTTLEIFRKLRNVTDLLKRRFLDRRNSCSILETGTWNLELATLSQGLGIWNLKLGTLSLRLGIWDLVFVTWNLEP